MTPARHEEMERQFVETLRPRFEDDGYAFRPYPAREDLPDFMGRYEPDAVAIRADRNIAIEVKSKANRAAEPSVRAIRHLFEGRPDWQLRVFYIGGETEDSTAIPTIPRALLIEKAATVRNLILHGQIQAAFLMSWSLLEAAARMVEPGLKHRPQSAGTVVQALAMSGAIDPEDERRLRQLIDLRNRVTHGDLGAEPDERMVELVLSTAEHLLRTKGGS